MTKIINMTTHDVTMLSNNDNIVKVFPKNTEILRLTETTRPVEVIDGVLITHTEYSEPVNLPTETDDTYYIVSQMVKNNLKNRKDLLVPTDIKRNAEGVILGARALGV